MRDIVLKLGVVLAGLAALSGLLYLVLGVWNRLFGGWRSVFFCYAGNAAYLRRYAPPGTVAAFRWRPSPIGVLRQGDGLGLVLAAPMVEADFLDPANAAAFRRFQRRLGRIARVMGVRQIHMAGILPGVLCGQAEVPLQDSREVVVRCVLAAAEQLGDRCFGGVWPPVILLGGAGFVGAGVAEGLAARGRACHVVDPVVGAEQLPDLGGMPALLIDLSRPGALAGYADQLWPGLVLLNETFPEPPRRLVHDLATRGVAVYHLSGVRGRVLPPLPFGYADAVPCCAVHDDTADLDVLVVQLAEAAPGAAMEHRAA